MRSAIRRGVAVLVALLLAITTIDLAPSANAAPHKPLRSSVWLPYWEIESAVDQVVDNAALFTTASMFWYDATSCSTVRGYPGAGNRSEIAALRRRHVKVVATVTASGLTPARAIACLGHAKQRRAHVRELVRLARSRAYSGIDIDYEHLALTTRAAKAKRVRATFSLFVRDLCTALRKAHKSCTVTVMPRTDDSLRVWRGKLIPGVYDYAAIGAAATRMRVMAYDQHAGAYGPGPIAGLPWVRKIIAYTKHQVRLSKVELGIPTYGRDFAGHSSVSLFGNEAAALARRYGRSVKWNAKRGECTFSYRARGVKHTVWYACPRSVAKHTRVARNHGMAGAAYWAAGLAPNSVWRRLR